GAKIAVMGGEQAAKTLLQIEKASLKAKGEIIDPEVEKQLLAKITDRYNAQTTPYYAAARLWVDAIISPMDTRKWISMGIEAANHAPVKPFNPGILQT
ncbi:MAG: carboxyl transferase domain-containing protein, partial [Bacteroidota bacterium]